VVLRLAKQLNIKSKNLSYAGLKDKRGITSQRMCCRFLEPKRLIGMNRSFFGANEASTDSVVFKNSYIMGDFEFSKTGLNLGDLCGNKFSIVLRDCEETTQENLDKIKSSVLENGFINYFGLQRFGNSCDTHEVGKSILMKEYQSAVELILIPHKNAKKDVVEALNHYSAHGEPEAALNLLSFKHSLEGLILTSLVKAPTDYKRALKSLHHKQQTLYAHAYQSYVWNRLVSRRIRTHGTAVLAGDLVYSDETQREVRRLSPEEVPSSQLADVLLPMPGYDVQLPDNCCKVYISEILDQDGMSIDDFKGPLGKEFNVSGCYRNIIYKPSEFDAEIIKYSDEHEKLVSTNLDSVLGRSFEVKNEGNRTALRLHFTLPRSCYATMLLREIGRTNRF
jgi:tRNA pseudouridine13 synthase